MKIKWEIIILFYSVILLNISVPTNNVLIIVFRLKKIVEVI